MTGTGLRHSGPDVLDEAALGAIECSARAAPSILQAEQRE